MGLIEEDNVGVNDFFEEKENIAKNSGIYNTDIVKLVGDTPIDLPEADILQLLLHHKLSLGVNPTPIEKSVEKESDNDLTELNAESKNNELISPRKSAKDKVTRKAAKSVIWYNSSNLLP